MTARAHLAQAVERGLITMAKVDEIVGRVLTEKFRLGLFEKPYADENAIDLQNDANPAGCARGSDPFANLA